jgi:hypothetical protein
MAGQAYKPYLPLNVLKPVGPDIWLVDGPEINFSYLGLSMPFPTRMTVVRLRDGGIWIHSPVALEESLLKSIIELGPVRYLIAPNSLHYWWIPDWQARFPEARFFAVPGLAASAKRELPAGEILQSQAPAAWSQTIDQVIVAGDVLTEADFFHRPSRTLILTDLIENFEIGRVKGVFYKLLLRLGGVVHPDGKSPRDMQLSFFRHRAEVRRAVEQMIAWGPENIIVAHGRWYESNGVAELKRAFRWVYNP